MGVKHACFYLQCQMCTKWVIKQCLLYDSVRWVNMHGVIQYCMDVNRCFVTSNIAIYYAWKAIEFTQKHSDVS